MPIYLISLFQVNPGQRPTAQAVCALCTYEKREGGLH